MNAAFSPTRFVVYTSQRSGSEWLREMLNSHPEVEMKGELFLHRRNEYIQQTLQAGSGGDAFWAVRWSRMGGGMRRLLRPHHVFKHLDHIFEQTDEHTKAIGFKLMYDQSCLYPEALAYLIRRRIHVVHLVRENHLDVILSQETRRRRDQAHATKPVEQVQVHLDPDRLITRLHRRERAIRCATRLLSASRLPYVRLTYESAVANPAELTRLVRFLQLEKTDHSFQCRLKKLNTASHWQLIENYEAVRRRLSETRFASLLQSPDAPTA